MDSDDPEIRYLLNHRFRMFASGMSVYDFETLQSASPTMEEWLANGTRLGEKYEALGDDATARGHVQSAAEHFVRAAVCYHFAQFLYYGDANRKRETKRRAAAAFRRATPHLTPPAEPVTVTLDGAPIFAYLRKPSSAGPASGWPCVLLVPGGEATKEELHTYEDIFLRRGMATLNFDGPGQGETWEHIPLSGDYPRAVAAILDHLETVEGLDSNRLGIMGVSLGARLAPMAATQDARLRACISICGRFTASVNPSPMLLKGIRYMTHAKSDAEAIEKTADLTMEGRARELTVPTLVVHAGQDRISPVEEAYLFQRNCGPNVEVRVFDEANHVCHNISHVCRPFVADWMANHL